MARKLCAIFVEQLAATATGKQRFYADGGAFRNCRFNVKLSVSLRDERIATLSFCFWES